MGKSWPGTSKPANRTSEHAPRSITPLKPGPKPPTFGQYPRKDEVPPPGPSNLIVVTPNPLPFPKTSK
jgi:hypothetical protein